MNKQNPAAVTPAETLDISIATVPTPMTPSCSMAGYQQDPRPRLQVSHTLCDIETLNLRAQNEPSST